ncbi:MobV family relaxase [Bacteroides uniformis]|uniref:MobV family relaxase n=1 Tax=Bacteroides uniformis TaxID=820 RepID=UPI0039B41B4F
MAQHAILRFEKHKGNPARPLEAHHERQKEQYASNPDIDTSRSKYNFHIVKPEGRYYHFIQNRIEQAGCRTRKDSTRFVDTLVTASPEFFKGKSPKEIQAFFQRAADFLIGRVGRENIVSAVVHMDEKTPHLHLTFVPLTKDNRLCAKEIIGNRANLTKWQDDFHAYMVEKYPDLERGESASRTGRKHIPTRLFKQAVSLSRQARAIEATLDGINPLNAGKKKEEALSMLKKWFPQMENFSASRSLIVTLYFFNCPENEKLEARAKASEKGKMKDTMERAKLKSELDNLQRLVDRIPPDILAELKRQQRHTVKER